jgi:hypothetical protein
LSAYLNEGDEEASIMLGRTTGVKRINGSSARVHGSSAYASRASALDSGSSAADEAA